MNANPHEGHDRRINLDDIVELKDLITNLSTKLQVHIEKEAETAQALKELVIIWKGSRIILPFMAACIISLWGMYEWAKDHLK